MAHLGALVANARHLSSSRHVAHCWVCGRRKNLARAMVITRTAQALLTLLAIAAGLPAAAQAIYPIDRAEILAGARFDLKVEFPGSAATGDMVVTVNGRDAAQAFGKAATVDSNEEGQGHTAYWIRDVALARPGAYEVTATTGDKSQSVRGRCSTRRRAARAT